MAALPVRRSSGPLTAGAPHFRTTRTATRMPLVACVLLGMALTGCDGGTLDPVVPEVAQIVVADARLAKGSGSTTVSPSSVSIEAGKTVQLVATDASGTPVSARWSSSDAAVAVVAADGVVTGIAAGSATITARTKNQSAKATVTVTAPASAPPSSPDFAAVVQGIRPRGFGTGTYALLQPASGARAYYVAPTGNDAHPGTSAEPFRTINRAAQVAAAGDVVVIRAGTYQESVQVRNSGTADRRIVFQAEERGKVVLTGGSYNFQPYGWSSGVMQEGPLFVTVRGLVFREYAPQASDTGHRVRAAVGAIRGWRIEDCLFDRAGYNGVDIRGNDVAVVRSTFQYTHTNAVTAWSPRGSYLDGIQVVDVVLRGNHTRSDPLTAQYAESVSKFLSTRGTVIDNLESYENRGAGFWFDTDNTDYAVRNSYFHHNDNHGIFVEINVAPGLLENNVFVSNGGPAVKLANSAGVTVRGNLMAASAQCVALVNVDRGTDANGNPMYPLRDITIEGNHCKDWKQYSAVHALAGTFTTPAEMRILADRNLYEAVTTPPLAWWPNSGGWLNTIPAVQTNLGWEAGGRVGTVTVP